MMEKKLLDMMKRAGSEETAVTKRFSDGMELLVYPLPAGQGRMIGVGYGADRAHLVNLDDILQRRTADVARFGPWLPALFEDGSPFLVMRVDQAEPDEELAARVVDHILAAQELLS